MEYVARGALRRRRNESLYLRALFPPSRQYFLSEENATLLLGPREKNNSFVAFFRRSYAWVWKNI